MSRTRSHHAVLAALALTLCAAGLTSCGSSSGSGSASSSAAPGASTTGPSAVTRVKTTVLLDWFPNPDHASLYLAQSKGYFAAAGADVTLQPPSNTTDAIKMVSLGDVDMAVSYEPEVIIAKAKGLKVTAVGAIVPTALNSLIISNKSGVTSPAGLVGKKVGSSGLDSDTAFLSAIGKHNGVDSTKFSVVTVSQGLVPAMLNHSVAAIIGGYRNVEAVQLADEGLPVTTLPVTDQGVPNYDELVLIANTDKLASDAGYREKVRRVLAGLAKGDAAAQADPSAAYAALKPVAKGYSDELLQKMVDATTPLYANSGGFGRMVPTEWQSFADWMKTEGMITTSVDAASLADDSLLPSS